MTKTFEQAIGVKSSDRKVFTLNTEYKAGRLWWAIMLSVYIINPIVGCSLLGWNSASAIYFGCSIVGPWILLFVFIGILSLISWVIYDDPWKLYDDLF